jgi:segregation and condensation protein B
VESVDIKKAIGATEAILFACGEPLEIQKIAQVLELDIPTQKKILTQLKEKYEAEESGLQLVYLDNFVQLCTKAEYAETVRSILDIRRNVPLSQAALEVLAIIAYNQPVTKAFVEQVRGVDCSGVIQTLILKGLVEERGRLELPGRPLVYGTTPEFLKCFCVNNLSELPELPDHEDLPKNDELPNQLEINLDDGQIIENTAITGEIQAVEDVE